MVGQDIPKVGVLLEVVSRACVDSGIIVTEIEKTILLEGSNDSGCRFRIPAFDCCFNNQKKQISIN